MADININEKPIIDLQHILDDTIDDFKKIHVLVNKDLSRSILKLLKRITPKDTGDTSDSWTVSSSGKNGLSFKNTRGHIFELLISGTRPHEIRPRNKSVLLMEIGGSKVFAKFVKHPGYKSQIDETDLMQKVTQLVMDEFDEKTHEILDDNLSN